MAEPTPTEDVVKGNTDLETTTTAIEPAAETVNPPAPIPGLPEPEPIPAAAAAPTAATTESTPAAAPPRERELVADPRLATLRAMFPDFDDSLLQSVLDSVNGNTDRAIDALLGMSDPDFTSEHAQAHPEARPPQEELDEQLARTLMLEDEREHQQQAHAWRAQQQQPPPQRPEAQRRASEGPEKDTMQEFQEQFNKFAESGKKTIGSLFSKVKAKIQEFDQPAGDSSSSAAGYGAGAGGDTYPYDAHQNPYPYPGAAGGGGAQGQGQAQPQYNTYQSHAAQQATQAQAQMPAYYDPNASGGGGGGEWEEVPTGGYDVGAPREMNPGPGAGASPPPPTTNAGRPQIDGGKLGMLPKRPVSLLRTNSPPHAAAGAPPDDDELEYTENPFEEGRK